jgi:benzoyl-CoA reductase/2-hydroxyglutaryl-CoA dehydratase subunit BcrC/BadD/HgdB
MDVFLNSSWVPPEWIEAHGFQARAAWARALDRGSPPIPAGACAFAEAATGLAQAQPEAAFVFESSCDQMRRAYDVLVSQERSHLFLFNLPATSQSPAVRAVYRAELARLGQWLERLGGQKPILTDLWSRIERRAQGRVQLLEAAPISAARAYAQAVARFHWDGTCLLPGPAPASYGRRIALALLGGHITAAHWDLFDTIERYGGSVGLNATVSGERGLTPSCPARLSADPLADLTEVYLSHCVDVYQRPNTALYTWLRERLLSRQVRGVVLWTYVGCDLWRAETQHLREAFGLPVLLLETEGGRECSPRNAGRIQAFLESLQ